MFGKVRVLVLAQAGLIDDVALKPEEKIEALRTLNTAILLEINSEEQYVLARKDHAQRLGSD